MSIILDTPILWTKKFTKPKHGEPKTSIILLISVAISIAIVLLPFEISNTEAWLEQYSMCRDKIIGFEQMGLYKSPDDFRLALSYCDLK
jgi:hypothetical protein